MKKIGVIICAAGSGSRLGGNKKKQFIEVLGRTVFMRSIEFFAGRSEVKQILLCISPEDEEMVRISYGANLVFHGVKICTGGQQRFETVAKALEKISPEVDLIAVHDAARCCLKPEWVDAVFEKASQTGAAMPAAPVVATIKQVRDGVIVKTVDRSDLYEAQTPQVFDAALLRRAYAGIDKLDKSKISDDSQLIEALGVQVHIVATDQTNLKITTQGDIAVAEAIINSRQAAKPRGYVGPYEDAQW